MIKVELVKSSKGVSQLIFTSNKTDEDQDILDAIGNAIISTTAERRGGYDLSTGALNIFVKDGV